MDEKPKHGDSTDNERARRYPCPVCGGLSFTWGKVQVGTSATVFKVENGGLFDMARPLIARECNDCGSVLVFTEN